MASDSDVGPARGVLRPMQRASGIEHTRRAPAPDLRVLVAHYWSVRWDLRGRPPHVAETLPHPTVHLVCEDGATTAGGVSRRRFTKVLTGQGLAFGIKLKPGAF